MYPENCKHKCIKSLETDVRDDAGGGDAGEV